MNSPADVPVALSAFLRGVERRGVVLAELQCGRRETGEIALAASLRAFRQYASDQPMAQWPRGFWSLLAAAPPLRQAHPEARWPQDLDWLADLSDADRMALLLRLAAGLDEDDAAAAMDVDQAAYRAALTRACPRDDAGQPDPQGWRDLAEAVQQHLRALSPERLAHLSRLRETLVLGTDRRAVVPEPEAGDAVRAPSSTPSTAPAVDAPANTRAPVGPRKPAKPFPWTLAVVALVVLCALAAVGAWWWHGQQSRLSAPATVQADGAPGAQGLADEAQVKVEALSSDNDAAARFDAAQGVLTHPDFDLLMDPQGQALSQRAGLLAWYAAAPQDRQRDAAQALAAPPQEAMDVVQ
ncbi:hypothetical protein [Pseudoxanthomonas sp.]|uniref:hypothetical protein n=1 Tax=Pseudoxanthomonas sp. TaxID=1871049 RepID=UPI0026046FE1|nr:hypothetical protein [Pseudoxanthomonas sp.]WDS37894.1 MAG: hypothetical protein O8I58_08535 [Pseudoxanthomonas sp.]